MADLGVPVWNPDTRELMHVDPADADSFAEKGLLVGDEAERAANQEGIGGQLATVGLSGLHGLTLGASDYIIPRLASGIAGHVDKDSLDAFAKHFGMHGADLENPEAFAKAKDQLESHHRALSLVSDIAGSLAPFGLVGKVVGGAVKARAALGALEAARAGRLVAQAEAASRVGLSAAQAGLQSVVDSTNYDTDLSGEQFFQSVGMGGLLGAGGEAAGFLLPKAVSAAQRRVTRVLDRAANDPSAFLGKVGTEKSVGQMYPDMPDDVVHAFGNQFTAEGKTPQDILNIRMARQHGGAHVNTAEEAGAYLDNLRAAQGAEGLPPLKVSKELKATPIKSGEIPGILTIEEMAQHLPKLKAAQEAAQAAAEQAHLSDVLKTHGGDDVYDAIGHLRKVGDDLAAHQSAVKDAMEEARQLALEADERVKQYKASRPDRKAAFTEAEKLKQKDQFWNNFFEDEAGWLAKRKQYVKDRAERLGYKGPEGFEPGPEGGAEGGPGEGPGPDAGPSGQGTSPDAAAPETEPATPPTPAAPPVQGQRAMPTNGPDIIDAPEKMREIKLSPEEATQVYYQLHGERSKIPISEQMAADRRTVEHGWNKPQAKMFHKYVAEQVAQGTHITDPEAAKAAIDAGTHMHWEGFTVPKPPWFKRIVELPRAYHHTEPVTIRVKDQGSEVLGDLLPKNARPEYTDDQIHKLAEALRSKKGRKYAKNASNAKSPKMGGAADEPFSSAADGAAQASDTAASVDDATARSAKKNREAARLYDQFVKETKGQYHRSTVDPLQSMPADPTYQDWMQKLSQDRGAPVGLPEVPGLAKMKPGHAEEFMEWIAKHPNAPEDFVPSEFHPSKFFHEPEVTHLPDDTTRSARAYNEYIMRKPHIVTKSIVTSVLHLIPYLGKPLAVAFGLKAADDVVSRYATNMLFQHEQLVQKFLGGIIHPVAKATGKFVRQALESQSGNYGSQADRVKLGDIAMNYPQVVQGVQGYAANPQDMLNNYHASTQALASTQPGLIGQAAKPLAAAVQYMASQIPPPAGQQGALDQGPQSVPRSEQVKLLRTYQAINDPLQALKQPTSQTMAAIQAVHPATLQAVRTEIMKQMTDPKVQARIRRNPDLARRLSLILGQPLRRADTGQFILNMQQTAQSQGQSAPAPGAPGMPKPPSSGTVNMGAAAQKNFVSSVAMPAQARQLDNLGD